MNGYVFIINGYQSISLHYKSKTKNNFKGGNKIVGT
jgi:hypothetical protein